MVTEDVSVDAAFSVLFSLVVPSFSFSFLSEFIDGDYHSVFFFIFPLPYPVVVSVRGFSFFFFWLNDGCREIFMYFYYEAKRRNNL